MLVRYCYHQIPLIKRGLCKMKIIISILSIGFLLGGCTAKEECEACKSYIAPPAKTDECKANELQYLVGKDRAVLNTMRFGVTVRILEPNSMITMDYSPSRVNIYINKNGKIQSINCG
jgi:PBP1b-binding outer membrane lipoprotein LpoB